MTHNRLTGFSEASECIDALRQLLKAVSNLQVRGNRITEQSLHPLILSIELLTARLEGLVKTHFGLQLQLQDIRAELADLRRD